MIDPLEKIQIVDKQDNPTHGATKAEAWKAGLYHRIVRVIVEDKQGNILLQHRSKNMQLWPNCWDNSASGHVDAGEPYEAAVKRELSEELGIKNAPIEEIDYYSTNGTFEWRILNRFVKLYRVKIDKNTSVKIEEDEIDEVRWFTQKEIKELIQKHPEEVTDGLIEIFERAIKYENHGD